MRGDDRCYTASTEGSAIDTVLAVYSTTTGCDALSCLAENDDTGSSTTSRVSWIAMGGVHYYILVAKHDDEKEDGQYALSVTVSRSNVKCLISSISDILMSHLFSAVLLFFMKPERRLPATSEEWRVWQLNTYRLSSICGRGLDFAVSGHCWKEQLSYSLQRYQVFDKGRMVYARRRRSLLHSLYGGKCIR